MNILKNSGMTEDELISQLFYCHPLPQLIISRNYKIFLGDEAKKSIWSLWLRLFIFCF